MTEIIDLEGTSQELDYDCLYSRDSNNNQTDTDSPNDSVLDVKQPRLITIKSYTEICIEAGETTEEPSPRVKPKFKPDTKLKDSERSNRLGEVTPDPKRKLSKPKVKFPKSTDKVNVWSKQEKAKAKKKERAPCWLVVFVFCCGVSKEHQWYSLLGKGVFLSFFMAIMYLVASLTVLPFLIIAAVLATIFFSAGILSYLALSSKKVGVSIDDDGDRSCLGTVWGSWV
ncbi:uncharacterized protein LOC111345665 [Stylophora pistillata]|uniref:Uncharacterized protein n=1 Tax=Stylophora pistillata TaxID=50429 RepID=A0A2B4RB80_STYPI|nr:uncharacterized protein LOC111345665 [Stylophora pistillata]XP_022808689.1 uncharacterized protein LOC111345665 [Stylophora pistillata]PFX13760.1 hypothetical protein AWC38_SpisGene22132 [Stylophora pistillata]